MELNSPGDILAHKKPAALQRYMQRIREVVVPSGIVVPTDPEEALLLGMRLARKQAYEDGLVDGVDLGIEVFSEQLAATSF